MWIRTSSIRQLRTFFWFINWTKFKLQWKCANKFSCTGSLCSYRVRNDAEYFMFKYGHVHLCTLHHSGNTVHISYGKSVLPVATCMSIWLTQTIFLLIKYFFADLPFFFWFFRCDVVLEWRLWSYFNYLFEVRFQLQINAAWLLGKYFYDILWTAARCFSL